MPSESKNNMTITFPDDGAVENFLVEENLRVPIDSTVVFKPGYNALSKTQHRIMDERKSWVCSKRVTFC
jgi:hypothetical protein